MRKYYLPKQQFAQVDTLEPHTWIKVVQPTSEDIDYLCDEIGVPDSFIGDTADTDERPRTEEEDGWRLTIIRIPIETPEGTTPYSTIPIGVISHLEKQLIVTICYHRTDLIPDFITHNQRKGISVDTDIDFILRLIMSSAVWFLKYLKQISFLVLETEEALEKSIRNEDLLQMMRLQKCLVYFNTSIRGNESVIGRFKVSHYEQYDIDLAEDVAIELNQAYNMVNVYSDVMNGTMDAFGGIINNNINTIMRRMTSISMILMLPTLVASLYGMNVDLPLAEHPLAFVGIMVVCLIFSAIAFWLFKRIHWF